MKRMHSKQRGDTKGVQVILHFPQIRFEPCPQTFLHTGPRFLSIGYATHGRRWLALWYDQSREVNPIQSTQDSLKPLQPLTIPL